MKQNEKKALGIWYGDNKRASVVIESRQYSFTKKITFSKNNLFPDTDQNCASIKSENKEFTLENDRFYSHPIDDKRNENDETSAHGDINETNLNIGNVHDPFALTNTKTKFDQMKICVFGFILVPLRILVSIILVTFMWLITSVALLSISTNEINQKPLCGWRIKCKKLVYFLAKIWHILLGFKVTVIGNYSTEAPIFVAAPHTTLFDSFLPFWISSMPSIVSKKENRALPLIGKLMDIGQTIFVARDDPNSRTNISHEIVMRANSYYNKSSKTKWPQTILFPEGTTTNGKELLIFKNGSFIAGLPVQPILIRYPNDLDTVTWTRNNASIVILTTLAMPYTRVVLEFLPVYTPTLLEMKKPELFSNNVRRLMVDELRIHALDMTYRKARQVYHADGKLKTS